MKTPIDKMVDRFLGWKLPEDFYFDAGISFDREYGKKWGMPMGANLLHGGQAKTMFEYCAKEAIEQAIAEATAEINELRDVLRRIRDILADAGHPLCNENGNLIREALKQLVEERDQLAAQAAEIAELRAYNQTRTDELAASVRQCAELRAEIAELRKDAERYRFARSRAYVAVNPYYKSCLWTLRGVLEVNYNAAEAHGFDAAIDAAIDSARSVE